MTYHRLTAGGLLTMPRLSSTLTAAADEADARATTALQQGDDEGATVARDLAAILRRLAEAHRATTNDPEQHP